MAANYRIESKMADEKEVQGVPVQEEMLGQSVVVPAMAEQVKKGEFVKCVRAGQDGQFGGGYYEVLAGAGEKYEGFGEVGNDMLVVEDDNGHVTLANINPDYPRAYEFALMERISDEEQAKAKKDAKKKK